MNPLALLAALRARAAGGGAPPGMVAPPGPPPQPQQLGRPQQLGPPPSEVLGGGPASGGSDPRQLIQQMVGLGTQAMQAIKDPIERAGMAKIVAQLHDFAAQEQKDRDAAMGAGPAAKVIRRQTGTPGV